MSWVKFMLEKEKKAECWQRHCGSDELHGGGEGGEGDCLLLREEDWKDLWSELAGRGQETIPKCPGWNVGSLLTQVTERETLICSFVKWEDKANLESASLFPLQGRIGETVSPCSHAS